MQFNDDDRKEMWLTVVTNVDPATATVHLDLDGTEYACTWQAAAVESPVGTWTRLAHTDAAFAGPGVDAGEIAGATALAAGRHVPEVRLRVGGRIVAATLPALHVG